MQTTAPSFPQLRFHAMGTDAHVAVTGGAELLTRARRRIDELEDRWSRFRPDSELCRINAAGGRPVEVHALTFALLERSVAAWQETGGAFDPTVLAALRAAGYDRSFELVARTSDEPARPSRPAPGCAGVELDPVLSTVRLPAGVGLDLGGIAKGFAADVVAGELVAAGADGALVNLGGDLRIAGAPPWGEAWVIELEREPGMAEPDPPVRFALAGGGVATTSSVRRTWRRAGRALHHVIDPRTGTPVAHPPVAVTVLAGEACRAEAVAKAAFVAGPEASTAITAAGATGLVVTAEGSLRLAAGVEAFLS